MATTTPNLGLTLPTGTEKVSRQIINDNMQLIDTAVGEVDTKIDDKTADSGWLTENGFSYRKIGNLCIIRMTKGAQTVPVGWSTLLTMPEGFRPQYETDIAATIGNDAKTTGVFRIKEDGKVDVYNSSNVIQYAYFGSLIYFI